MNVNSTASIDRKGVSYVQLAFEEMGHIFREQSVSDYGIDAHVEIVSDQKATGRLLALQIKSGSSWFKEKNDNGIVFREDMAHLEYWLHHSLAVIVVLYDPDTKTAFWQVVNDDNAVITGKGWKIEVPYEQTVTASFKDTFEALSGNPIKPHENYSILSWRDVSHGNAKRYSANVLVSETSTKLDIFQIIREVTNQLKHREYYRNEIVKRRWENKPAQVIFLFIYRTLDDVRNTSWIFRSLWIDENLPSQFAPTQIGGEPIGDNIVVDRSQNYELLQTIRKQYSLNKEEYLAKLEASLRSTETHIEKAATLTVAYNSGRLSSEKYANQMMELEPIITELYLQAGNIGLPPLECQDLDQRFQSLMAQVHNIVLPFSDRGLKKWKENNRRFLVNKAIEDYRYNHVRLEFELEKIH